MRRAPYAAVDQEQRGGTLNGSHAAGRVANISRASTVPIRPAASPVGNDCTVSASIAASASS
jgi:hypothetical protein